ncbi:MAG: hypothetical protein AB7P44_02585 [Steroidobacteraceae bacterium]
MAEFRISPAFRAALKARLESPKGQQALDELARLIAETAFQAMPSDLRETLATEAGMAAFREAWPDIVEAFFRGGGTMQTAVAGKRKEARRTAMRRRTPAK